MSSYVRRARSQLFTVRIWLNGGAPTAELRGYVQHVTTGRGCHFRSWQTLLDFLTAFVPAPDSEDAASQQSDPADG